MTPEHPKPVEPVRVYESPRAAAPGDRPYAWALAGWDPTGDPAALTGFVTAPDRAAAKRLAADGLAASGALADRAAPATYLGMWAWELDLPVIAAVLAANGYSVVPPGGGR